MRVGRSVCRRIERSMRAAVDLGVDGFEGDVLGKVLESGVGYGR